MTTFGFILGEVFRRVTGNTVGHYLRTEIAELKLALTEARCDGWRSPCFSSW